LPIGAKAHSGAKISLEFRADVFDGILNGLARKRRWKPLKAFRSRGLGPGHWLQKAT
jgi:mannose/cellobiose epimerase-like protein (N-acyl-D-glucosamine 2-epimerase family)